MGVFKDYVDGLDNCAIEQLPVNHIANINSLEKFLSENEISNNYLGDKCEVFNEHYLYIFYGRAAFRLNNVDAYPMCFVFKKPNFNPVKVFPFDSGAFHHKLMEKYFNKELTLDEFDFSGNNDYIYRVIKHFFEDNDGYFDEKNKTGVSDNGIPEIKGYLEMIAADSTNKLDGRKSSIELIYDLPFNLYENLKLVILPELDLNFSSGEMTFAELKKILETKYSCEVKSYPNRTVNPVDSSYKDIKKIVKNYIINNGVL